MKINIFFIVLLSTFSFVEVATAQIPRGADDQISPKEAELHMGEHRVVDGFIYKAEFKRIGKKKAIVLIYLSDQERLKPMFIKIIDKIPIKQDNDGTIKSIDGWNLTRLAHSGEGAAKIDEKAVGKIIKYNGLPAIITNYKDVQSFETSYSTHN